MNIEFNFGSSDAEQHTCESFRDGDWIIYTCDQCPGYERRMNWRTREMKVRRPEGMATDVLHTGSYFPYEYEHAFTHVN